MAFPLRPKARPAKRAARSHAATRLQQTSAPSRACPLAAGRGGHRLVQPVETLDRPALLDRRQAQVGKRRHLEIHVTYGGCDLVGPARAALTLDGVLHPLATGELEPAPVDRPVVEEKSFGVREPAVGDRIVPVDREMSRASQTAAPPAS